MALLLKHLQWKEIHHKLGNRLYSNTFYYGLKNRLSDRHDIIESSIPVKIRTLRNEDINILFGLHASHLSNSDISDRLYRHLLANAGIQTCYVAETVHGDPCAALWLIAPTENTKIKNISNDTFPTLAGDEMLLEGLFTLEKYRNMHIMAHSIGRVLSMAKDSGTKKVISFVHHENKQSLQTLKRVGFVKYLVKREKWFLFFRTLTFEKYAGPLEDSYGQSQTVELNDVETILLKSEQYS